LFFADRRLGYFAIACALYFTNISATEFIGGSQSSYNNNMTVMAWGVSSVLAMLIVSEFIIPIYVRGRMLTTPDFLERRYDVATKKLASVMFLDKLRDQHTANYFIWRCSCSKWLVSF
jgi:SSS family solute:Na+ symporter